MRGTHVNGNANALGLEEIELLAKQTQKPEFLVKMVYDAEFARLKTQARITDYLALLASRHTRELLLRAQT